MDEEKKHPGGRPRKYNTPEEMQVAIDKYFTDNDKPTICGLALGLGFIGRQSLLQYEGYSEEFFVTIKTAKSRIEANYEGYLQKQNVAGPIFALKNFGWKDDKNLNIGGQDDNPLNITITVHNEAVKVPERPQEGDNANRAG